MDETLDSFAMGFVDGGGGQEGVTVAPIPMDIKYLHAICNFSTQRGTWVVHSTKHCH